MPTGVYQRTSEQIINTLKNFELGRGWNRGKNFKKLPKTIDRNCYICKQIFKVGRTNGRYKFCSKQCKIEAFKIRAKERYKSPVYREQVRKWRIARKFNISIEKYNELFNSQNGKCAICNISQKEVNRLFAIDHNHITKKIRGLLCSNCNTGIGNLRDSPELLQKAINYLRAKH